MEPGGFAGTRRRTLEESAALSGSAPDDSDRRQSPPRTAWFRTATARSIPASRPGRWGTPAPQDARAPSGSFPKFAAGDAYSLNGITSYALQMLPHSLSLRVAMGEPTRGAPSVLASGRRKPAGSGKRL